MYALSRITSESSTATNASESTEQTDLSDDGIVDCDKNPNIHTNKGFAYSAPVRNTTTRDSNIEDQRGNLHTVEENDHGGYFKIHVPSAEQEVRYVWIDSQRGNYGTKRESVPLLVGSERQYAVQDIIKSEGFKKVFESEYADIVKNYKRLKKLFLILAVLNIILIICAASVMPVILVSLRLENGHAMSDKGSLDASMEEALFEKLNSPRAKEIIRQHMPCDDCRRLSDKLEAYKLEIQKVRNDIDILENAVISLQLEVSNNTGNASRKNVLQKKNQKTFVQKRVEDNNQLLNKLLNRKRSSMQLTGTVINGQIVWEEDVFSGNIMSHNSKGILVKSGGTYFVYSKIQFTKRNCTGTEIFEYHVMKEKESANTTASYAKQRCTAKGDFEQSLNVQKIVEVPHTETATFYIKYNSVVSAFFSRDFKTHVFGLIEI
ncbi:uncharacterized protein LOC123553907 [Mercenaria mercenaria]|uniref:uncharacterized protein LOC123553907 n=1 Tax=Mercenaria mercenaria TaxID=6596 RepID=UPI00234EB183|nr:uncharacterized protein LOC123553907 [Mercenaria mercenaria]